MAAVEKKLPLQSSNAFNSAAGGGAAAAAAASKKTIEQTYQKKTQLEHILLRPDTYIGSVEKHTQTLWVYEDGEMACRSVTYVPGLYKIFDEILVNAADNKQRDPSMDSVKVDIDVEHNCISIYNNGDGVPVEIHQEEGVYVPEMIFGHLLTSSNYDDAVKKTTGGRNGYGAKLTNIFSTEFIIQTADGRRQKKYKQVFTNNMGSKSEPTITKCKESENWTKVTFKPDLAKFNMTHLEEDAVAIMKKRVVDLAGCLGKTVKVELNGQRVPVKSFLDYVNLYLKSAAKTREEESIPRSLSLPVSFVNGIATIKGGTHVDFVTNQIANHLVTVVNKKNKNANMKPHTVRNHLWVFVNALIDNPAFDSQTKETLTTRQGSFGSKCELSQEFLKKVAKSGVVESLLSWADFKQSKELKKTDGTKTGRIKDIKKLNDANEAGTRNAERCTLILTEGDSAKALAVAGISVVGSNYYGVFPLRGKLLNVREASHKQMMENVEIQHIKKILGLQQGKIYDSVKTLRYGHLMIMTDQDHDGSHIKGLLINFFHSFWPSLLKIPSFLVEFITPIVKATNKKTKKVLSFYSMPEFESWKESVGDNAKAWTTKYYKGLGTSTSEEGKDYFKDIDKHKKEFVWENEEDSDAIELAFSKKKIEQRKNWLRQFEPGTHLDQKEKLIKYKDFVNKELILFSVADLQRSIPSMVDGLKPGQRKILFSSFKKNFVKEAKVAQFSGYVSEHSAYHHGEQSLATTIIGMAQNFIGSNNINLLQPLGQYGTRHQGGKDHASARYMPIIPMVLVNGSEGIGTGWSSYIPNYNPRELVENVKCLLNGEPMKPMDPWYKGFKGSIEKSTTKDGASSYVVSGIIEKVDETTLKITELPIRRWTEDYKEFLESVMTGSEKIKDPFIKDFRQHNGVTTVHFEVILSEENMKIAQEEGLLKRFKLTSTISTSNMHLFDAKGTIKKYENPEQSKTTNTEQVMLDGLEQHLSMLDNKVRFILAVVRGEIVVSNRRKVDLLLELRQKGFTPSFSSKNKASDVAVAREDSPAESDENGEDAQVTKGNVGAGDYGYLLSMPIGSLTLEKVQELLGEKNKQEMAVEELKKETPKTLWWNDLDAFLKALDEQDKEDALTEEVAAVGVGAKASRNGKNNARKNNNKKTVTADPSTASMTSTAVTMDLGDLPDTMKSMGRGASKKEQTKKPKKPAIIESDEEEDDELLELKERLAKYNLESPTDETEMETDMVVQEPTGNERSKRAATKKPASALTEISDDEEAEFNPMQTIPEEKKMEADGGDELEVPAASLKIGRGRGRKPASGKVASTGRKRGVAAQSKPLLSRKVITDVLKLGVGGQQAANSPEKKVRKMRASPFNKKSGSVLGRINNKKDKESSPESGSSAPSNVEELSDVVAPRARPRRENRGPAKYTITLSDSETEEADAASDSDFDENGA
ncbi:hypothetical protein ACLOJK_037404 [Asimina triloba]